MGASRMNARKKMKRRRHAEKRKQDAAPAQDQGRKREPKQQPQQDTRR